jgi:hypothetical protein
MSFGLAASDTFEHRLSADRMRRSFVRTRVAEEGRDRSLFLPPPLVTDPPVRVDRVLAVSRPFSQ